MWLRDQVYGVERRILGVTKRENPGWYKESESAITPLLLKSRRLADRVQAKSQEATPKDELQAAKGVLQKQTRQLKNE